MSESSTGTRTGRDRSGIMESRAGGLVRRRTQGVRDPELVRPRIVPSLSQQADQLSRGGTYLPFSTQTRAAPFKARAFADLPTKLFTRTPTPRRRTIQYRHTPTDYPILIQTTSPDSRRERSPANAPRAQNQNGQLPPRMRRRELSGTSMMTPLMVSLLSLL